MRSCHVPLYRRGSAQLRPPLVDLSTSYRTRRGGRPVSRKAGGENMGGPRPGIRYARIVGLPRCARRPTVRTRTPHALARRRGSAGASPSPAGPARIAAVRPTWAQVETRAATERRGYNETLGSAIGPVATPLRRRAVDDRGRPALLRALTSPDGRAALQSCPSAAVPKGAIGARRSLPG